MLPRMKALLCSGFMSAALTVVAPMPAATVHAAPLILALEAEVATLDPHFTTAYISRAFGYMVFDTLFGLSENGELRPQMVESYETSEDRLIWTFRLREGLRWHNGTPVTAADCVASIQRWQPRAALGRLLAGATASLEVLDAKSFKLTLKEPFGLVLDALGRPNTPVPFMLPERLARTPGDQRISEIIGSGPFVFRPDLYRPGDRIILDRNPHYVPRLEPADLLAGGKLVRVEGLELRTLPDGATAAAALQAGEIDYVQYAPFDLLPVLERNRRVAVMGFTGSHSYEGYFRLNHASPPFNDPEIRRVLWRLFDQSIVLDALGLPERHVQRGCRSFFMCGTPYETTQGGEIGTNPSVEAAREALRQTKYSGEKVVVLQATDIEALRVSSAVAADLLGRAGFNVELQAMDWGTLLSRRTRREGWSMFGVTASGFDLASPLTHFYLANNCSDYAGWSCDERLTPLFASFRSATSADERRRIAGDISAVAYDLVPAVMWGQFAQPAAYRANLRNIIPSSIPIFWNVEK